MPTCPLPCLQITCDTACVTTTAVGDPEGPREPCRCPRSYRPRPGWPREPRSPEEQLLVSEEFVELERNLRALYDRLRAQG